MRSGAQPRRFGGRKRPEARRRGGERRGAGGVARGVQAGQPVEPPAVPHHGQLRHPRAAARRQRQPPCAAASPCCTVRRRRLDRSGPRRRGRSPAPSPASDRPPASRRDRAGCRAAASRPAGRSPPPRRAGWPAHSPAARRRRSRSVRVHEAPPAHEALRRPVAPDHAVDRGEIGGAVARARGRPPRRLAPRRDQPVGQRRMVAASAVGTARRRAEPGLERLAGERASPGSRPAPPGRSRRAARYACRAGRRRTRAARRAPGAARHASPSPGQRMADLVAEHRRELRLVADQRQHAAGHEDPPAGQREGVGVRGVEHREAPAGRAAPAAAASRRPTCLHVGRERRVAVDPAVRRDQLASAVARRGRAGGRAESSAEDAASRRTVSIRPAPPAATLRARPGRGKTQALD